MSLSTRLTLKTLMIIAAVVAMAVVAWWGLTGLNRDLDAALDEYDQLREVYQLAVSVEQVRAVMRVDPDQSARLQPRVVRVMLELEREDLAMRDGLRQQLQEDFRAVYRGITEPTVEADEPSRQAKIDGALNKAINGLFAESNRIEQRIAEIGEQADQRRQRVTRWVAASAVACMLLVIGIGYWQYRAVMGPLRRLERGVKRLAQGDFARPLSASGDREFVRLAGDFNRMAEQLRGLYDSLEQKVRVRSAQLAQSERLASVGFLAAGVAHEINNPLAIMAGEAELALQSTDKQDTAIRDTLSTIRDEAFRCKAITQKLITLARPGSGVRDRVDLFSLAEEVAGLTRTLPQHEGKTLDVAGQAVVAETDPAQLKQVLLNLTINALEATAAGGKVTLAVEADPGWARLRVVDCGRGMTEQTLEKVFEPFYTEKQTPSSAGLGLGLSISHAIVEDLGGRLTADSAGLGRGSTFTIELPREMEGTDKS